MTTFIDECGVEIKSNLLKMRNISLVAYQYVRGQRSFLKNKY